jgi:hypothetical protein
VFIISNYPNTLSLWVTHDSNVVWLSVDMGLILEDKFDRQPSFSTVCQALVTTQPNYEQSTFKKSKMPKSATFLKFRRRFMWSSRTLPRRCVPLGLKNKKKTAHSVQVDLPSQQKQATKTSMASRSDDDPVPPTSKSEHSLSDPSSGLYHVPYMLEPCDVGVGPQLLAVLCLLHVIIMSDSSILGSSVFGVISWLRSLYLITSCDWL